MNLDALVSNVLHPPILFFFLGIFAILVRSDLNIPPAISKFLSIYLLFDIGIKGGVELFHSGFNLEVLSVLLVCVAFSFSVPFLVYGLLRRQLNVPNAGAIAATYGSISAVTFATGISFLESQRIPFGGYMVAGMALMESPAIVAGLMLIRRHSAPSPQAPSHSLRSTLHESFFNGSVLLLLGSLVIGYVSGKAGEDALKPFVSDIFKGMLSLYMLDMGLEAGKKLGDLRKNGLFLVLFGLFFPLVMGAVGIGTAWLLGLSAGNALLLTLLFASSSFIAVPAAMRMAVPEANMGLLVPMSLGVTNTFCIVLGIPLFNMLIQYIWTLA
jgi:hypothetical protein